MFPFSFKMIIAVMAGLVAGLGAYTFIYAKGYSYMTNDPKACNNCHIMNEQFDGWAKSSHKKVAACNDCHTPHDFFGKYLTKALNGYHHSYAFTAGNFHEPIMIGPRNRQITQDACRHCHAAIVAQIDTVHGRSGDLDCIRCHNSVGHMHISK